MWRRLYTIFSSMGRSLKEIIAKILANRLVVVLGDIVNEGQSTFIANRKILDGLWVANVIVDQAAAKIGCAVLEAPLSYLGSKVGGLMSRVQSWNEIVNNLIAHLSKWKMKTLSIGGILTLLKSVLGSMPIYHMSLFNVPVKVLQIMESIRCHFFNDANHNGSSLWARVIKGIHGEDDKLGKNVNHSHSSIWLDIVREMEQLRNHDTNLISFIHKKMGNGDDTSFWEDVWRGDGAFKSLYPRIYALETCKNINIALKMSHENVGYSLR
ncbi:hypothetical protein Tco_0701629 [Tanacetum coccineum]